MGPRIVFAVFLVSILLSIVPQSTHAQDWTLEDLPQEQSIVSAAESSQFYQNWNTPVFAETPTQESLSSAGIESTSEIQPICKWLKVVDENLRVATSTNVALKVVEDGYAGKFVFVRSSRSIAQATIEIKVPVTAEPYFQFAFARFQYRRSTTSFSGSINSFLWENEKQTRNVGIIGAPDSWRQMEFVFGKGDQGFNKEIKLKVEINHDLSKNEEELQIDQMGIGICTNPPLADPEISEPGEIGSLYANLVMLGGLLVNHGTNAAIVLQKEGLLSFRECWERGLCGMVLNRKWILGMNPNGITEGVYRGDEFWISLDTLETWYHAGRSATTRCFDIGICQKFLDKQYARLAAQIESGAPEENIRVTRDLIKFNEGKLSYAMELLKQGRLAWAQTPMNIVMEMRPSELSRTFDGGRYQYVLNGIVEWSRVRALEFQAGTSVQLAKEIHMEAIKSGAPRNLKLVIGDVEIQISFWSKWAGQLKNWGIPNIIAAGGSALTSVLVTARAGAAIVAEHVPHLVGITLAADAAADSFVYYELTDGTNLSVLEYMKSESLITAALSSVDLIDYQTSVIGMKGYTSVAFKIPRTEEFLVDFTYNQASFVHPDVTSYMGWKVDRVEDDLGLWLKKDGGHELFLPFNGTSTYTMVYKDAVYGLVLIDFNFSLVRWYEGTEEATIAIAFTGFRTPEEYGAPCPGWLPPEDANKIGRDECYTLPPVAYLPIIKR